LPIIIPSPIFMEGGVCPACVTGFIHEGTPKGTVETVAGLPTYVAKPADPKSGVIVIIPDVFGWDFPNNRLLADEYADKAQMITYLPDFMFGSNTLILLIQGTRRRRRFFRKCIRLTARSRVCCRRCRPQITFLN